MLRTRTLLLPVLAIVLLLNSMAWAITPAQESMVSAIEDLLKEAGKLVVAKNYAEAAPLVVEAEAQLQTLTAEGAAVKAAVTRLKGRIGSARRLLEKNGVTLPAAPMPGGTPMPAGGVSFTKDVVPMLVGKCGRCHVQATRGGFSMATFSALMKGSEGGIVVQAGSGKGSRIVEVIESGDMPRGGGRVEPAELATLVKWIDAGAKFDGPNPEAPISAGQPAAMERPMLQVVQSTGSEKSKFSRDIAPILASECIGCHGGMRPARQLSMETFARLLNGSEDGPVLTPGNPAASLLIRKIKGEAGAQMPLNKPALSAEVIAKFETWVQEGAKFDGADPNQSTNLVAQIYRASQMSHEELAAYRKELAMKNWQLTIPNETPDQTETENFLLLGNIGQERLVSIGQLAEQQVDKVARLLKAPADQPLLKGRMTLFVFQQRYDYSEYGQMVEGREIPQIWQGHWRYNGVDAYGCIVPPKEDEYSLAALIGQQLAGAYIDTLGTVPSWFSQGSAWAIAAKVDSKDPRAKQWDENVLGLLAQGKKPDDFLTGALPPGETSVLNYSFASFLMSVPAKYSAMLNAVRRGTPFDAALQQVYGGTAQQLATPWAAKLIARRGR